MAFYTTSEGAKFHYLDEGSGDPVMLVHGVGSSLKGWDPVLPHLADGRRYVRLDLRGHGDSARLPGPYSLKGMSQDVLDLANHLELERFALAGFSLGGLIAQRIALDHGARLRALMMISTVAGRTEEERQRVLERRDILAAEGPLTHLANAVERWFTPGFIARNPDVIARRREQAMQNDPDCYMAAYNVLAESDLGAELSAIAAPTLIMTGEHDIGSNARMARFMKREIADVELHILDGLKHSVLLEAPKLVARHMNGFLDHLS